MSRAFSLRKTLLGIPAGLVSAPVGLFLVYLTGIIATAINTQDFFATLLVAVTYLPIMLFFVLFFPSLALSLLVGLTLSLGSNFNKRASGPAVGAITGFLFGEIVLSLLLPLIVSPQPGDFTSIVSNHYLSGGYGLILGIFTSLFFRWMSPE
jgi:hypothetical protein